MTNKDQSKIKQRVLAYFMGYKKLKNLYNNSIS